MAGNRGVYTDGPQEYHGGDPNRDIATALAATQRIISDLYGSQNVVFSGFTLSVVSGMQVQVGAGVCYASGLFAVTAPTTLTINTTSTQPRYTILRVTVTPNNPNGTDGATGNNLIADTNVVDFVDGTPGASPSKPTLSSAYQVQVGSILLPASTSALTSGMLNTLDCAPNSLYDPSPLTNANTHRAASYPAGATIHGIAATAPGGTAANALAQTDSSGRVGHAITADSATSATTATTATTATNATQLGGVAASGYDAAGAAATVQTNLNGHAGTNLLSGGGVHGVVVLSGTGSFTSNGSNMSTLVSFGHTFGTAPLVKAGLYFINNGGNPPAIVRTEAGVQDGSVGTTGFSFASIGYSSGQVFHFWWEAIGS